LDKKIKQSSVDCSDLNNANNPTQNYDNNESIEIDFESQSIRQRQNTNNLRDTTSSKTKSPYSSEPSYSSDKALRQKESNNFRRIILLVIAVTVHNIPEGLAVGVGFGAIGKAKTATFQNARNLALGIGIQNFPEGLAVSLPLYASGMSRTKAFWYGQLSGMVEPLAGLLGVLGVGFAQACLPYALAFAAGAMLYVVFDNLMPEAASHGNSKLSTWCCMFGFCLMMSLDVGLN
jgi:zinc transporter 11